MNASTKPMSSTQIRHNRELTPILNPKYDATLRVKVPSDLHREVSPVIEKAVAALPEPAAFFEFLHFNYQGKETFAVVGVRFGRIA